MSEVQAAKDARSFLTAAIGRLDEAGLHQAAAYADMALNVLDAKLRDQLEGGPRTSPGSERDPVNAPRSRP